MNQSAVQAYLQGRTSSEINLECLTYIANLEQISKVSPLVAQSVVREFHDQRHNIKLIASENYCSISTQLAMGNLLTDKYAEGYPHHRFYAGCDNVDEIEAYACELACKVFNCEHAYVQAHSGADANLIAFWAILNTRVKQPALEQLNQKSPAHLSRRQWDEIRQLTGNQRLLAMDYYAGGHLTHGYRFNVSAQMFDVYSYAVDKKTRLLNYDEIESLAREVQPLILLAGYSAYPRAINFRRMREIADGVGAVLMVDMAHFAGLVAGGVYEDEYDPIPFAHVVTTTTHKTLRGPRGGLVLCKREFAEQVDKGCPSVIGGPLPQVMAAKAVALTEVQTPEFKVYSQKIVDNARALAEACIDQGLNVVTGGTDNHLILVDVSTVGLTGRQAESAVRECGITLNRNALAFDPHGPWYTSGLRLGTPAVTTLGMGIKEMKEIASILALVLKNTKAQVDEKENKASQSRYTLDPAVRKQAKQRALGLLQRFPLYPSIDLEFLKKCFA